MRRVAAEIVREDSEQACKLSPRLQSIGGLQPGMGRVKLGQDKEALSIPMAASIFDSDHRALLGQVQSNTVVGSVNAQAVAHYVAKSYVPVGVKRITHRAVCRQEVSIAEEIHPKDVSLKRQLG